ncbi:MAG TPA: hypothetical protein VMY77_02190 [Chitinophagaceae bacterium]|nr:hypothetical protein [Chitinophagaceae bacterium]
MRQRSPLRGMAIAFFVIALSFWNFSRLTGSDCIRAIHIVTLLTAGAGIGVFLTSFFLWIRTRSDKKDF